MSEAGLEKAVRASGAHNLPLGRAGMTRHGSESRGGTGSSRQDSRGASWSSGGMPFAPASGRLMRTPSQDNLITKLRYKEVLDWINRLPLPHIERERVMPEALLDGTMLWDIALHTLRPDVQNNREQLEGYQRALEHESTDPALQCMALHDLGQSYQQMNVHGSAIEVHTAQLYSASMLPPDHNVEFIQQAVGDLGDVFRTLGDKEVAHNLYQRSLGIRGNSPKMGSATSGVKRVGRKDHLAGDLRPWPRTPGKERESDFKGSKLASDKPGPFRQKGQKAASNKAKSSQSQAKMDPGQLPGCDIYGDSARRRLLPYNSFAFEEFGSDDYISFHAARRVSDVFNLIHEECGVNVEKTWPHRSLKEIKRADGLIPSSASRPCTEARSSNCSTSDDGIDDFLRRPGTGVLDNWNRNDKDILTGDEAMWIAWCLCWLNKHCDAPPEKDSGHCRRVDFPLQVAPNSVDLVERPSLKKEDSRGLDRAASFAWVEPDNLVRAVVKAGIELTNYPNTCGDLPSPQSLRVVSGFASNLAHDAATAVPESVNCQRLTFHDQREQDSQAPSRSRSSSRQLPSETWIPVFSGHSNPAPLPPPPSVPVQTSVPVPAYDQTQADPPGDGVKKLSPFSSRFLPGLRSDPDPAVGTEQSTYLHRHTHVSAVRPFSESELFLTDPSHDDGAPSRVHMSDFFSWQKLDGVSVSMISTCGTLGIITLVAGNRVGVFTTNPFKRVAEVCRKDAVFTCAQGCVQLNFVRSVLAAHEIPQSTSLRVDVPKTNSSPVEQDNFIVTGENSGQLIVANARTGVTRDILIKDSDDLGAVIMLKVLEGHSGNARRLYCAHKLGTLTLFSIEGHPTKIWRTRACEDGSWLTDSHVMRSCVVTCDGDERCLRIWNLKAHCRGDGKTNEAMLDHLTLHQQTQISSFTGFQEPMKSENSSPMIVSGGHDGTVQVWGSTPTQDKDVPTLLFGHKNSVTCLFAFSRARVCSGSADKTCRIWDPQATRCTLTLSGHKTCVNNVWCDDTKIISADSDGHVRIWSFTGTCICILESETHIGWQAPQPTIMLVFQKPFVIAMQDSNGGITIWCRDAEYAVSKPISTSTSPQMRSTRTGPPRSSSIQTVGTPPPTRYQKEYSLLQAQERCDTLKSRASTSTPPAVVLTLPTPSTAARLSLGTATSTCNDPADVMIPLQMSRRMWWGSREERNPQLWPTGRPWQSVAKAQKHRPAHVRSRQGTPATAHSQPSSTVGIKQAVGGLGRMTSFSSFSSVDSGGMFPALQVNKNIDPTWTGNGRITSKVAAQPCPNDYRQNTTLEMSLSASRRALVLNHMAELEGQLRGNLLKKDSMDYMIAAENLAFLRSRPLDEESMGHLKTYIR